MTLVVVLVLCGAAGSACRYVADVAMHRRLGRPTFYGTSVVNVAGSFLIGLFLGLAWHHHLDPLWRAALITGFCGGFTTASTAAVESIRLARTGQYHQLALQLVGTYALSIALCFAGAWLGGVL